MTSDNVSLPLVTITLTTDELAMASAGLTLLRQFWGRRASALLLVQDEKGADGCGKTIERITALIQRIEDNVTEEQGSALLTQLIRDYKRNE